MKPAIESSVWTQPHPEGLVLRTWRPAAAPAAIVGCCILRASDLPKLLEHAPSWYPAVERAVFVLGSWSQPEGAARLLAVERELRERFPRSVVIQPAGPWPNQSVKRSRYFAECRPGELAFVIDADEELLEGPSALEAVTRSAFDVGWLAISAAPRYEDPYGQPRLFRIPPEGLCYGERHYWVTTSGGRLVAAHRYGGAGWHHERVPLTLKNEGGRRTMAHAKQYAWERQVGEHAADHENKMTEALRIVQLTHYDAGLAVYRLHSAINATTRERSIMCSDFADNPLRGPEQFDVRDRPRVRKLVAEADVVHCHLSYAGLEAAGGLRTGQTLVIHHHGTMFRNDPEHWHRMDQKAQLRLGSTMDLLLRDKTGTLDWLPNPVPVALYRQMRAAALAERPVSGVIRIAHSPSKPRLKGTEDLTRAVEKLRAKGLPVELELITGVPHAEALWRKASCDLMFDSFWLGIQVSGIEAAAMGMPVIAGDAETAGAYRARLGQVPYTFADASTLEAVLEQLVVDVEFRAAEAARVAAYVLAWHDEAAVALRYLDLLAVAIEGKTGIPALIQAQIAAERRAMAKTLRIEVQPVTPIGGHFKLGARVRHI